MNKEWVLAKELLGVGGLPRTIQGIHKRAKKEAWEMQDVIQEGVRGRSIGYRLSSLPDEVQKLLFDAPPCERANNMKASNNELEVFLCALSNSERRELAQVFARHGVSLLLELLDEDTPELLKLSKSRKKLALLSRQMTEENVKEISERFQGGAERHSLG